MSRPRAIMQKPPDANTSGGFLIMGDLAKLHRGWPLKRAAQPVTESPFFRFWSMQNDVE